MMLNESHLEERVQRIKMQIGITESSHDELLKDLFERYLSVAKQICFRQDESPAMLDIVADIVAGAYNQRGGEGFSSSGAGEQQYKHTDLYDTMRKRLINAGLRSARGL